MSACPFASSSTTPSTTTTRELTPSEFNLGELEDERSFNIVKEQFSLSISDLLNESIGIYRDSDNEIQESIRNVNKVLRSNYKKSNPRTGLTIYPLLLCSEEDNPFDPKTKYKQGIGVTFTLYLNPKKVFIESPVHPVYELLKISAHLTVGVYTIIEPYLCMFPYIYIICIYIYFVYFV